MAVANMTHHPNGLPRSLSDHEALQHVRDLVAEGGRVVWLPHAHDRMEERDISSTQILNVLKRGSVVEAVRWDSNYSNWKLGIQDISAGELLTVQVALDVERLMGQVVLVITAYTK